MNLDFVELDWFKKLCKVTKCAYNLSDDQAKVLTTTVALGKDVSVNQAKKILERFKGSCERSRADTICEALTTKGLLRRNTSGSKKLYKSLPYQDLWPEIEGSIDFLRGCEEIITQNQETINFQKELEKEHIASFEKEHDVVSYMRDLLNTGMSFSILRDQERLGDKKLFLWKSIDSRLRDAKEQGKITYHRSKVNAILLLQDKEPQGFIRLKKIAKRQGTPRFHATKILDPQIAKVLYQQEVMKK